MSDHDVHIDTARVQAPEQAAQQVQLRLSTKLAGADLSPPGLAPAQVLLVRALKDPEPGQLGLENARPTLNRTWERAVRNALSDCLRRAVRPTDGRVPPGAEAVLFRDAAEAWACWCRERVAAGSGDPAWWVCSLPSSADARSPSDRRTGASPGGDGSGAPPVTRPSRSSPDGLPTLTNVWQARPRLVPAMAAHLTTWETTKDVLEAMPVTEVEAVLQAVCVEFGVSFTGFYLSETAEQPLPQPRMDRNRSPGTPAPPWRSYVERVGGQKARNTLERMSPPHRQLLGVALALYERPTAVRTSDFQAAWRAWQGAVARSSESPGDLGRERAEPPSGPVAVEAPDENAPDESSSTGEDESSPNGRSGRLKQTRSDDPSRDDISTPEEDRTTKLEDPEELPRDPSVGHDSGREDGASSATPRDEAGKTEPFWDNPYAATDLGGVFYLVNVLEELDLPEAARTPAVGEHVGAWAVLEALARALLGSDDETRRPNDPLWHVLADLDGRPFEAPAGRALDAALSEADDPSAYRVSPAWYDPPPVDPPIAGRWGVADGRLRVWTALGCVADRAASDDPAAQAQAEWDRLPHAGELRPADAPGAMPLAAPPAGCAPLLERWARRAAPFLRARLAAALGEEEASPEGIADLFTVRGRVYSTDTHVDLVLPLDAARIDVRVAGLDRSPGWWAAGGRVVRFHFVGEDE